VRQRLQGTGGSERDRGTQALLVVAIALPVGMAAARATTSLIAEPYRAIGLIVMWVGLAIRVWAIAALGRSFRTTVEVDADQAVVSSGPYRSIRHPSYSGLLLFVAGCGLASGDWLALGLCVLLPLPALLRRIQVEEAELTRVLGDRYRAYQAQTKRLIPGLW
jgi:protein-S-isoprenylcysteine O-methyltransferase Ste14